MITIDYYLVRQKSSGLTDQAMFLEEVEARRYYEEVLADVRRRNCTVELIYSHYNGLKRVEEVKASRKPLVAEKKHGGLRPGAGRPRKQNKPKQCPFTWSLEALAWLREHRQWVEAQAKQWAEQDKRLDRARK